MDFSPSLKVNLGGIQMQNPVMVVSGTFAYGEEFASFWDLNQLGALVVKTITLNPLAGNFPPRLAETPAGLLNSIGLQNPGLEGFIKEKWPFLQTLKIPVIVSIAGVSTGDMEKEFAELALQLDRLPGLGGLELNLSCPNVRDGVIIAQGGELTYRIVQKVRKIAHHPLLVKLSPNVTDITVIARQAQEAGADALSLINTVKAMAVDVKNRKPKLSSIFGGLSGPAIKPIAVGMVWEVVRAVKIPVVGMGGIMTAEDALEFIIAGARAVGVGTANLINPNAVPEIIAGIKEYLLDNKISDINSLVGSLQTGST